MFANISPSGVVVSTPRSKATTDHPSRCARAVNPAKSWTLRERRSRRETQRTSARPAASTSPSPLNRRELAYVLGLRAVEIPARLHGRLRTTKGWLVRASWCGDRRGVDAWTGGRGRAAAGGRSWTVLCVVTANCETNSEASSAGRDRNRDESYRPGLGAPSSDQWSRSLSRTRASSGVVQWTLLLVRHRNLD